MNNKKNIRWIANPSDLCPNPTNEQISEYINIIYKTITKGKTPAVQQCPQLIFPIGAPGAGKSTIIQNLVEYHSDIKYSNYVQFDVDKLLDYLPIGEKIKNIPDINGNKTNIGYAFGWKECIDKLSKTTLIELVIKKLLKSNYNLILNIHYPNIIIDAQLNGYFCILVYIIVSKSVSVKRVTGRAAELGRIFSLNKENIYGWGESINFMLHEYKEKAVWYSLWADRFVIVNNSSNKFPEKKDFKIIMSHPITKNNNNWKACIKKIYNIIYNIEFNK
jgi:predicted ABC-type ATPase